MTEGTGQRRVAWAQSIAVAILGAGLSQNCCWNAPDSGFCGGAAFVAMHEVGFEAGLAWTAASKCVAAGCKADEIWCIDRSDGLIHQQEAEIAML